MHAPVSSPKKRTLLVAVQDQTEAPIPGATVEFFVNDKLAGSARALLTHATLTLSDGRDLEVSFEASLPDGRVSPRVSMRGTGAQQHYQHQFTLPGRHVPWPVPGTPHGPRTEARCPGPHGLVGQRCVICVLPNGVEIEICAY